MNIVIATNKKYVPISYVMAFSLFENNHSDKIDMYVLHSELDESDIGSLSDLAEKYGNHLISVKVDRSIFPKKLPTTKLWSIETYYRLAILQLLPKELDRILYLDVDIIVMDDLGELYNTDFEDNHFIACDDADPGGKNFPDRQTLFKEPFEAGYRYFNAGVMLWNLSYLRENYTMQDYLDLAKKLDYSMSTLDQDLLNLMHWGHIGYADQRYNYYARLRSNDGDTVEDAKKAAIIHYLSQKPWNADGYHFPIESIWWDYAKKTPYYMQLLEEFLDKTLTDQTIFLHSSSLFQDNKKLQDALNQSVALNNKLYGMLTNAKQDQ